MSSYLASLAGQVRGAEPVQDLAYLGEPAEPRWRQPNLFPNLVNPKTVGERKDALRVVQNGRCAVCEVDERIEPLYLDHSHLTGDDRGLLCRSCNTALGFMQDNIEWLQRAVIYLGEHQ